MRRQLYLLNCFHFMTLQRTKRKFLFFEDTNLKSPKVALALLIEPSTPPLYPLRKLEKPETPDKVFCTKVLACFTRISTTTGGFTEYEEHSRQAVTAQTHEQAASTQHSNPQ